jgi:AraC-like DNA-binding protein
VVQEAIQSAPSVIPDGVIAGLFISRSDVAAVARLLDDAGTTLCMDPAIAGGFLARASTMIASMLHASGQRPTPEPRPGGMAPWQVRRIQAQIDERLHDTLHVKQLAESVRLSTSYFARAFKISFGCSPYAYILQRRIDRAKALISGTATPLVQVSLECGLADQSHLSRMFRRHVGCTPSTWRRGTHQ